MKDNGKGKVELVSSSQRDDPYKILTGQMQVQKDLPTQLLTPSGPLSASLIIASFGSSQPYHSHAFDLSLKFDPSSPTVSHEQPLRYGRLLEIHHTFKSEPTSPPKIITLIFTTAVVIAFPLLAVTVSPSPGHFLSNNDRSFPVAFTWRQPKSLFYGFKKLAHLSHIIFRFYSSDGGCFLHVLYLVELVPNSPRGGCHWTGHFFERKPSST